MQTANIIGCLVFFLMPAMIFSLITGGIGIIAIPLLILGIFFYPMGLLSVILYDSVAGLDIKILLRSVRKTFKPYFGLFIFYVLILLSTLILVASEINLVWNAIFHFILIYLAFILAHLTGRFYWKYKNKLSWKF
jgi:hypothetical protein